MPCACARPASPWNQLRPSPKANRANRCRQVSGDVRRDSIPRYLATNISIRQIAHCVIARIRTHAGLWSSLGIESARAARSKPDACKRSSHVRVDQPVLVHAIAPVMATETSSVRVHQQPILLLRHSRPILIVTFSFDRIVRWKLGRVAKGRDGQIRRGEDGTSHVNIFKCGSRCGAGRNPCGLCGHTHNCCHATGQNSSETAHQRPIDCHLPDLSRRRRSRRSRIRRSNVPNEPRALTSQRASAPFGC